MDDKVDWQSPVTGAHPPEIPWSKIRRTRHEVAAFFQELGRGVRSEGFELAEIIAQDDRVVVEGKNRGTVRATGRIYEHEWVMVFSVRNGKIVRFRHYYDTADLVEAFKDGQGSLWSQVSRGTRAGSPERLGWVLRGLASGTGDKGPPRKREVRVNES